MGIYKLSFLQNFYCVIFHRNINIGIEYFLEKVLNFDVFAETSHSFSLNITNVDSHLHCALCSGEDFTKTKSQNLIFWIGL